MTYTEKYSLTGTLTFNSIWIYLGLVVQSAQWETPFLPEFHNYHSVLKWAIIFLYYFSEKAWNYGNNLAQRLIVRLAFRKIPCLRHSLAQTIVTKAIDGYLKICDTGYNLENIIHFSQCSFQSTVNPMRSVVLYHFSVKTSSIFKSCDSVIRKANKPCILPASEANSNVHVTTCTFGADLI